MCSARAIRKLRSIRVSLALWYSGTLMALVLLMDAFLFSRMQVDLTEHYHRFLKTYAADLGANLLHHPPDSPKARQALVDELSFFRPVDVEFRLFDEQGNTVFSSDGWGGVPEPTPGALVPGESGTVSLRGVPFKTLVSTLDLNDGRIWTSETAISLGYVDAMLDNYERNMWIFTVPLLIAGVAGGIFLARKALRPVVRMAATAREISSHNISRRLPLRGTGDELDHLANAINGMLDRLEEAFLRIERFSTDLAHELRTPITQLVGETEAALVSDMGEGDLRDVLAHHAETYASMASLTNDVLGLLRAGTPGSAAERVRVDLPRLLEEVVESFRPLAEESGVLLSYSCSAPEVTFECRPPSIRRMLSNLLDNALRYSTAGGSVEVVVASAGHAIDISVIDHGEGISAKDLPRVFERFYRSQTTRNTRTGFGLGLSIVKQIVEEHGGTVTLESAEGEGTRVDVRLPLSRSVAMARPAPSRR